MRIINLGDIVSGPRMPAETADLLMSLELPTVRGNHENQLLHAAREHMGPSDRHAASKLHDRHRAWLGSLPSTIQLDPEVFCCHGTPSSDQKLL